VDALTRLIETEAIKQLKYRYFRFLDGKQWDAMAGILAEDATVAYDQGKYTYQGREQIVEFLRNALGRDSMRTAHHGHHPEIDFTSDTTASGIWALRDTVIDKDNHFTLNGAAFYHDEYVKVDGEWKIRSTGYERLYEEIDTSAPGS
jgi:hypothetical protein